MYAVVLSAVGTIDAENDESTETDQEEQEDGENQGYRPDAATDPGVPASLAAQTFYEHTMGRPAADGVGCGHVRLWGGLHRGVGHALRYLDGGWSLERLGVAHHV